MSELRYTVNKSAISCAQNQVKTILYVKAATNVPIKVSGWGISFDGLTAGQQKILVELCTGDASGDGTPVGDATKAKLDARTTETIQAALAKYGLFSVEPTVLTVVHHEYVDCQNGWKEYFPDGDEIMVPGGKAIAIRVTMPTTLTTCNGAPWLLCEE